MAPTENKTCFLQLATSNFSFSKYSRGEYSRSFCHNVNQIGWKLLVLSQSANWVENRTAYWGWRWKAATKNLDTYDVRLQRNLSITRQLIASSLDALIIELGGFKSLVGERLPWVKFLVIYSVESREADQWQWLMPFQVCSLAATACIRPTFHSESHAPICVLFSDCNTANMFNSKSTCLS